MDFFDKLGKKIAEASRDVADKTKELTDTAKVKLDMKNKEDYIESQYTSIGKQYFESHQFDDSDEYPQIAMIKAAMDEIDELKAQLMNIKGAKECPNCHQMVPMDAEYCSFCGAKVTVEQAATEETTNFFNDGTAEDTTPVDIFKKPEE